MNTLCLENTIQILSDIAKKKDSEDFEKHINNITDYQHAMNTFVKDITKRRSNDNPMYNSGYFFIVLEEFYF